MNATNSSLLSTNISSEPPELVRMSMLCSLSIIGSMTVLLNVFVLAIVCHYSWMRTNANLIIASMAVTDLLLGLSALTSALVKWGGVFEVGEYFCLVLATADATASHASLQHVLAVNVERYLSIIKPLHYKTLITRHKLYICISVLWLWSFGLGLMLVLNTVLLDRCLWDVPRNPIWTLVAMSLNYPLPLVIISAVYIHIVIVILRQLKFLKKHSSGNVQIRAKQMKMIKSIVSIFAAYLICWAPTFCILFAVNLSLLLGIDLDLSKYVTMFYFVEVLAYVNSLINPFIYFLSSRSFQSATRKMLGLKDVMQSAQVSNSGSAPNAVQPRERQRTVDRKENANQITEASANILCSSAARCTDLKERCAGVEDRRHILNHETNGSERKTNGMNIDTYCANNGSGKDMKEYVNLDDHISRL